jgi:hypothetical protein
MPTKCGKGRNGCAGHQKTDARFETTPEGKPRDPPTFGDSEICDEKPIRNDWGILEEREDENEKNGKT